MHALNRQNDKHALKTPPRMKAARMHCISMHSGQYELSHETLVRLDRLPPDGGCYLCTAGGCTLQTSTGKYVLQQ